MYTRILILTLLCLAKVSFSAPIIEDEESVQLLDAYQSRKEDKFEFKYELSDGQMREEKIKYDDLDNGIAIKGSYTIEMADGEMQTIYYISDTKGHRISIGVPFSDSGEVEKRPPPTRKPQNHVEARKKNPVVIEENKSSFDDNRIEGFKDSRVGRVQTQRKIEKITKPTTQAPKVEEKTEEVKSEPEEVTKPNVEDEPEATEKSEDDKKEESKKEQEKDDSDKTDEGDQ